MRTKILKNIVFLSLNKEIIHNEKVCDLFSADTLGRAEMETALAPYNLRTILIKNLLYLTKK